MTERRSVVLVSGLSGAGKSSILRILEDLGHEAVDNPPLATIEGIIRRGTGPLAIGVDVRTTGFDTADLLATLALLRTEPSLRPELVFAVAEEAVLLRRYSATRRRHPMARGGAVSDGISAEIALTAPLRSEADWVLDTSELPPPELRRLVEARYAGGEAEGKQGLTLSLISFAFPAGLPREADMVFDARFLRNPFYDTTLSSLTGLDDAVAAYVWTDPDYQLFLDKIHDLLRMVLPRFVTEGKKYATVAIGCSGGRHRSVVLVEALARLLQGDRDDVGTVPGEPGTVGNESSQLVRDAALRHVRSPIIVRHRELARLGKTP
ncbi:RNase adapter RapZ [Lichenicoccus roseus]|uniref:RNase adapter RapZ n=1 Tax=Lichenicoccus roseus TaxID=2683649 RepID=A0A5R9J4U1_9PROT|nr:RNase adapter RapZ [Lichenicoccus roseus]TLU71873.1 RNase adapter RapZ [Lichenicoccus roseus]